MYIELIGYYLRNDNSLSAVDLSLYVFVILGNVIFKYFIKVLHKFIYLMGIDLPNGCTL